jgi:hypothetical protein
VATPADVSGSRRDRLFGPSRYDRRTRVLVRQTHASPGTTHARKSRYDTRTQAPVRHAHVSHVSARKSRTRVNEAWERGNKSRAHANGARMVSHLGLPDGSSRPEQHLLERSQRL